MTTWIAFLKGVNVGGHNILPMKELLSLTGSIGWTDAKTYIQSGNCAFTSGQSDPLVLSDQLSQAIFQAKGFRPPVLILSQQALDFCLANNPFQVDLSEGNKVHFLLSMGGMLKINTDDAAELSAPGENMKIVGNTLYFHAQNGVGQSKLFARLPKLLNEGVTARNLRTMIKVKTIADALK